jgi:hypothetical protein
VTGDDAPADVATALQRMEVRLRVLQRTYALVFQRLTGALFPPAGFLSEEERAVLAEGGPAALGQLEAGLEQHAEAAAAAFDDLRKQIAEIIAQIKAAEQQGTPAPPGPE